MESRQFDPLVLPNIPSGSRILVADAWDATPHIETGLEIALRLAPTYSEVAYIHYGNILPDCEFSTLSRTGWASNFVGSNSSPAKKGMKAAKEFSALCGLNIRFIDASCINLPGDYILEPEALDSLKLLQQAHFRGSNLLGISLVSSLVSMTGNSLVNPSDHKILVENLAIGFGRCYYLIDSLLDAGGFDALVVFNGRFASVKGAVLAASALSKPIFFHERGCSMDKFSLKEYQPHDRVRFQEDVRENWAKACKDSAELQIARDFFISKRSGKEQGWTSFSDLMLPGASGSLIANARSKVRSKNGKVICFFSSSEDEYVSTEGVFESSDFEWKSQDEACRALAKIADKYGHSLVIRNHPHLRHKAYADRIKWDELEFLDDHSNLTVIKSDSAVDSYELIDSCDLVVVYGSTVGIEGVYSQKPVIAMSDTLYDEIGASIYKPLTLNTLDNLIGSIDSLSVVQESALPYGHYVSTFGISFQLYKPFTLFQGKFFGVDLNQRSGIRRLASGLKKIFKVLGGGFKSRLLPN
jgi:hypothetical protein